MFQRHASRRFARRPELATVAEVCEARQMLTGNVTGSVVNGDLVLTGDNANNAVLILPFGLGQFKVQGNSGTTINQQVEQIFSNVTDDFRINLRGGDDTLVLTGDGNQILVVPDDLEIDLGNGRDGLGMNNVTVVDDATLKGGSDADTFQIFSIRVQNARLDSASNGLKIDLGSSNTNEFNQVEIRGADVLNQGNLIVNDGSGRSLVRAAQVNVAKDLRFDMGSEQDLIEFSNSSVDGNATIETRLGDDSVFLVQDNFARDVTINTSHGADNVGLGFSHVAGKVSINTGNDNDRLALVSSGIQGDVTIDTSSGEDQMLLKDSVMLALLTIRLGTGNDLLRIDSSEAADVSLDGGTQADVLELFFSNPANNAAAIQDFLGGQGFELRFLNGSLV